MEPRASHELDERLLVLAPVGRDAALTCALLVKAGLQCRSCGDIEELCRLVDEGAAGALIAEEALTPPAFKLLSATLERQESWSDLPIVLFTGEAASPHARRPTSKTLAPLGNVSLLERPLRPITMVSAARAAVRARRRQYAARGDLLRQQQAVRERDQFLAMLGHELRNPLGAIVMATEMLARPGVDGAKYRAMIRRQAGNLSRIVDDLLDVARVTSGKLVLRPVLMDLGDLVQRCLDSMDATLKAQRLTVRFTPAGRAVPVEGDLVRLEQIIMNLMTNAAKYTPQGGRVGVSLTVEAEQVAVLRLEDSGVGIAPEMLGTIFDLFAQAPGSLDRASGGMGIGLTLVRRLVELHRGTVVASSPGLGQGSVFTVRLPLSPRSRPSATPAEATLSAVEAAAALAHHDVLIVEDNVDSRETLQSLLEAYGHRVDAVGDGITGVARALAQRPAAIVIDIGLPGLDGYQMARQVREALGPAVYLVALTGYGQPDDQRRALEAGFNVHLTKPIDPVAICQLLGRPVLGT